MKFLTDLEIPDLEHANVNPAKEGYIKLYVNQGRIFKKDKNGVESELSGTGSSDQNIDGGTFN